MPATWKHPDLGEFKYKVEWTRPVSMPGFASFTYDKDDTAGGTVPLNFDADDEDDTPPDAAAAVAMQLLANQIDLAAKVVNALWDDFNGRGPQSGMWWRNRLDEVTEAAEDLGLLGPTKPADLAPLLGLQGICIHRETDGYDQPVAELQFAAAFEEEHGVGVLTDGINVLGIGYISDVRPFPSF